MGRAARRNMSPVSSPTSVLMIVTPVSFSPAAIAAAMGAAPRYLGSRLAWTFQTPMGKRSSVSCDKICPYAQVTIRSAPTSLRGASSSRSFTGCKTGMPRASAACLTGEGVKTRFLPCGLSGWVSTAATPKFSAMLSNAGTAKSGVPAKTIFMICSSRRKQIGRRLRPPFSHRPSRRLPCRYR